MRLRKEQIQQIAHRIVDQLKAKKLIIPRTKEHDILTKVIDVITADLVAEDALDAEARKLMDQYRPQIASGDMDERRAFLMIKKQLAKEKKLVI